MKVKTYIVIFLYTKSQACLLIKDENTFNKYQRIRRHSGKKFIGLLGFNVAFRCHFKPVFNCSLFQMTL